MTSHFYMPVKLLVGPDVLAKNSGELRALGSRCLVVTGKNSARACGALDDAEKALQSAGVSFELFDEATPNPLLSTCARGAGAAKAFGADFILGIGGGSPLDAAKCVALLAANDQEPASFFSSPAKNPALPIALVGTTSGTGSEVTPYSVITDDTAGNHSKRSLRSLYAAVSFGDPAYTKNLPAHDTISTALDALTHCIESYFNQTAGFFSDRFALKGASIITRALKQVSHKEPEQVTPREREALYYASLCGGFAIAMAGTCYCHSLGYFLSERHGVSHGIACAAYLPSFIRRAVGICPDRADSFFAATSFDADELVSWLESLFVLPDVPLTAGEAEALAKKYEGSVNYLKTPGTFDAKEAQKVLEKLFVK